jgi:ABC-type Fe3+/spermidine/putrescine transport system ATPase subunit
MDSRSPAGRDGLVARLRDVVFSYDASDSTDLDGTGPTDPDARKGVVLRGVDLDVPDHSFTVVMGASGGGKSTLLRTFNGIIPDFIDGAFDGEVTVRDRDATTTRVSEMAREVGMVIQDYEAQLFGTSIESEVAFGPENLAVPPAEIGDRIDGSLSVAGLADLDRDRAPDALSGGQKQRVVFAGVLAMQPELLLLDEPMTGLDAKLKSRLQREIGSLLEDLDVTALYVTHDQAEAMVMCDRIAVMNDGTIEQVGTPDEVYERPANDFVADFVGTSNRLAATARDGRLDFGHATAPAPNGDEGEVTVVVRPEAFELGGGPFSATVRERFYLGEHVRAVAELPDGQSLTLRFDPTEAPAAGEEVSLALDTDRVHVLSEP